jgi:hypothetical protein
MCYLLQHGLRDAGSGPQCSTRTARRARYLQWRGKCCALLQQVGGSGKRLTRQVLALRLRQLLHGMHYEGAHSQLQGLNRVSAGSTTKQLLVT